MQSPIAYCMTGKRRYLGDSQGIFSFLMSSCCIPKASVVDAVCLPKCHVFTDEELKDDEFVCWRRPWRSWWLVLQVLQLKGKGNQQGTARREPMWSDSVMRPVGRHLRIISYLRPGTTSTADLVETERAAQLGYLSICLFNMNPTIMFE